MVRCSFDSILATDEEKKTAENQLGFTMYPPCDRKANSIEWVSFDNWKTSRNCVEIVLWFLLKFIDVQSSFEQLLNSCGFSNGLSINVNFSMGSWLIKKSFALRKKNNINTHKLPSALYDFSFCVWWSQYIQFLVHLLISTFFHWKHKIINNNWRFGFCASFFNEKSPSQNSQFGTSFYLWKGKSIFILLWNRG